MSTLISVVNRRVSASSSFMESFLGSTMTRLAAPYGMPTTAHFRSPHRGGLHSSI